MIREPIWNPCEKKENVQKYVQIHITHVIYNIQEYNKCVTMI